eukprot:scaffold151590_cov39-Prasinocladus_malaysianus.AAC.1
MQEIQESNGQTNEYLAQQRTLQPPLTQGCRAVRGFRRPAQTDNTLTILSSSTTASDVTLLLSTTP